MSSHKIFAQTLKDVATSLKNENRVVISHALLLEAANRIEHLEKAIDDYLSGNYEHPGRARISFGKCRHGRMYFETCESCDTEHFKNSLKRNVF